MSKNLFLSASVALSLIGHKAVFMRLLGHSISSKDDSGSHFFRKLRSPPCALNLRGKAVAPGDRDMRQTGSERVGSEALEKG